MEFQNLRGQSVRLIEIISPVPGGVSLRRTLVLAQPNDQELWEETTTIVPPDILLADRCRGDQKPGDSR